MGDFRVLFVKNEKVPGALRGAGRHDVEKAFHGFVILEHGIGLRVDSRPDFLTLSLLHGGVFFLGQLGLFLLGVVCKTVRRVHAVVAVILGLLTIAWMSLSPLINEGSPFYRFHCPLHTYLTIVFGTTVIFLTGFLLTALNRRGAE